MDPVFFRPDIHHQMRPMVGYIGVYAVYWAHFLGYYSDVTRTVVYLTYIPSQFTTLPFPNL